MKGKSPLGRWADGGAILVAFLAALALAATVIVARAELASAAQSMARGEADALFARLQDAEPPAGPPTREALAAQLETLRPSGLRYVAVIAGDGVLEAGTSTVPYAGVRPGTLVLDGERALLVRPLPPPPPGGPPPNRPRAAPPGPPPTLVIEFVPSVLPRVKTGLNRTLVVAALAVPILLALAVVLTLRAVRRTVAARDAEQTRRLAALGQMSGVMAHELRNPLASLKGNAQLLEEMLLPDSRERKKAALVVREAERMERLTEDLLSFVREGELTRQSVTPAELVERVLANVPRDRVEVELADAPRLLWIDPARLGIALENLVRNALQAAETPIVLRLHAANGSVRIEVRDRGPGVPEGKEDEIFEPFFTTRVAGTGLGLPVALRVVAQHGGTLTVTNAEGGGALFVVTLPDAAREA